LAFNFGFASLMVSRRLRVKLRQILGLLPPPEAAWLRLPAKERFMNSPSHGGTVFLGDSLTSEAQLGELFGEAVAQKLLNAPLLNRGVPGDTTSDVLARLDEVTARSPERILLLIGANDLFQELEPEGIRDRLTTIWERVQSASPNTQLTLLSLIPVRESARKLAGTNKKFANFNVVLEQLARQRSLEFIDLFAAFVDHDGQLDSSLTYDNVHLKPAGYWVWRNAIVKSLEARASLLAQARDSGGDLV
jgi:lysophospholipase L1-like esterase